MAFMEKNFFPTTGAESKDVPRRARRHLRPPGTPRYAQIAEQLLAQIASGALPPEGRLPSERELSARFKVSRMTLRAALRVLDNQGMLSRRPGDGTYVARPKIELGADRLVPFTSGMRRRGHRTGARLLMFEQRRAGTLQAEKLGIAAGEPIFWIERLRTLGRAPAVLERFGMPAGRFPGLEEFDLERESVYELIEREYGAAPHHSWQSLEAVAAGEAEAGLLGVPAGAALMLGTHITYDAHEQPIDYGTDLYRGDRFVFVTELAKRDF